MILVIDVGNTNTEVGVIKNNRLLESWRFVTKTPRTSDEYAVIMKGFFENDGLNYREVNSAIIASVVPSIMHSLKNSICKLFGIDPLVVGPGIITDITIKTSDPSEMGADRIIDAVAAYTIYGGPLIVIDFGTATTFDYVDDKGCFLFKVTAPGIQISAEALFQNAAQLPNIGIDKPQSILGKDTVSSMQAGLVYGYIGQMEYIVAKMREEIGRDDIKVIATGGYGGMFSRESSIIDYYDPRLSLKGLKIIHDKNIYTKIAITS